MNHHTWWTGCHTHDITLGGQAATPTTSHLVDRLPHPRHHTWWTGCHTHDSNSSRVKTSRVNVVELCKCFHHPSYTVLQHTDNSVTFTDHCPLFSQIIIMTHLCSFGHSFPRRHHSPLYRWITCCYNGYKRPQHGTAGMPRVTNNEVRK